VDQGPVDLSYRYEIEAEQIHVIPQRYPYAGARNADVQLLLHDRQTGNTSAIPYRAAEDDYLARVGWLGSRLIVQRQTRDQRTLTVLRCDPATAQCETLFQETAETWINLHDNFKPLDDGRFLWTSERSGSSHLYVYDDGILKALTEGPGRVNRIAAADDESAWILGWFEHPTEQHLYRVPLSGGAPTRVTAEAGWHEVSVSADRRWLLDRFTSLDRPGRVQLLPLQTAGTAEDVRSTWLVAEENIGPDHAYFPYWKRHVTPGLGTIRAEDGQELHFRLTRPVTAQPAGGYPVIVSVYGGPGVHRVKNEWPPLLLQLLASNGYGVLELDNRGSSNRSRAFETPIFGQLGDVEVRDQVAGARFLQSQNWVNPQRIGVFGHSYGGYMAIMCLARAGAMFKAGVAVAPVTDWRLYDTHYTERYLSTPADNPDGYAASSVFPHLDSLTGHLLLIHGMADDNVLYTHSTKLYRALQARNLPFEMMAYPGAKHALQERDVSIHRFNLLLDFFRRNL
jgi:dipeptidyl-peptidase-4